MMKKKIVIEEQQEIEKTAQQNRMLEKEQEEEARIELLQTKTSKKLVSTMVDSERMQSGDTLMKVADVLQNLNGNTCIFFKKLSNLYNITTFVRPPFTISG